MRKWRSDIDEIATIIAAEEGYERKDVEKVLRNFIYVVVKNLEQGNSLSFKYLGKFQVVKVRPTKRWNFKEQKVKEYPSGYKIRFIPSTNLKEAMRKLSKRA